MSIPVENTIQSLGCVSVEGLTVTNSVQTSDLRLVRLDEALWKSSPILRQYPAQAEYFLRVSVPKSSVLALLDAQQTGALPDDLKTSFDCLAVAQQLQFRGLRTLFYNDLRQYYLFDSSDLPTACSTWTLMLCFKALLGTPLRTPDIYEDQMDRIADHCNRDPNIIAEATNLINEKTSEFLGSGLEGIPINFNSSKALVVFRRVGGRLRTEVFNGRKLVPVNLCGKYFNPDPSVVKSVFFIKYGSYVLYKTATRVYRKDIRNDNEPTVVLYGCTMAQARGDLAFAVRNQGGRHSIWLWVDDERFELLRRIRDEPRAIDFEFNDRILAIACHGDFIKFYHLEDRTVRPLSETQMVLMQRCIEFCDKKVSRPLRRQIVADRGFKLQYLLMTYRILRSDDALRSQLLDGRRISTVDPDEGILDLVKKYACKFVRALCDLDKHETTSLFLRDDSLHVATGFPHQRIKRTLLTDGSCHSVLELTLQP